MLRAAPGVMYVAPGRPADGSDPGWAARVAQHEADHMDGILFIDRMPDLSTLSFGEEFRRYLASRPEPEEGDEKEGEAEE